MKFELPLIYPITDRQLSRKSNHLAILKELHRGGASLVQIRDKTTPDRELLRDLMRCRDFAAANNMTLILDDRCDLVMACDLMGVHLGQEDIPPVTVRALIGEKRIIGYSTHSLSQIRQSRDLPIQYIGFGPVFTTTTKTDADPTVGVKKLTQACRAANVPVVAIGGIGLHEIRHVLETGAASVAIISAIMTAKNMARQMERFLAAAEKQGRHGATAIPYRQGETMDRDVDG